MSIQLSEETLEYYANQLKTYGLPRIQFSKQGWQCYIEAIQLPRGVEIKVSSEVSHTSPLEAAKECLARVNHTLEHMIKK